MSETDAIDLMRLGDACREIFQGAIKPATLRAEHARGRLTIYRIGNKDFVSRDDCREMLKQCLLAPSHPASSSGQPAATPPASIKQRGSSATAGAISPQDACRATLMALRRRSPVTSLRSTTRVRGRASSVR